MMYFFVCTPPKIVGAVRPAFAATSLKYAMGDVAFPADKGAEFCGRAGVAKKKATANGKSVGVTVQIFMRIFDGNMGLAAIPKQYNRTSNALEYCEQLRLLTAREKMLAPTDEMLRPFNP
jgi:hypothetical protein